jgi:glucose/arabinose dehydrogenase
MLALTGPLGLLAVTFASCGGDGGELLGGAAFDWRSDWAVEKAFRLEIDTAGYMLPTAIAFVPKPGNGPKDPLYFVTELRGAVKVVTNDRSVHTFAKVRTLTPEREAPAGEGQVGLAGVCLEPRRGYVFVTYAYRDSEGVLRNNLVRFETEARTFALSPSATREFTDVFAPYESGAAHQIGACLPVGDSLFVSVGDGWNPAASQELDQLTGKVLRMTYDGEPYPGNPFSDGPGGAPYVWAYGLRNPFGLEEVEGRLFATNNGQAIDSFLTIERGRNYHWDGQDWSIGLGADAVFAPSFSPVQLDFYGSRSDLFPREFRDHFFFAVAGGDPFTAADARAGVVAIPYDLERSRVRETPRYFLQYRGDGQQLVVGLAFGPGGLYFVPLLPNEQGQSAVIRISHSPGEGHPFILGRDQGALALMEDKGCFSCHQLEGRGGTAGPTLDPFVLTNRLEARILSDEYLEYLEALPPADAEAERARGEVREGGPRTRIQAWVENQILTPGFDNPSSQMPDLDLTEAEAETMAEFLVPAEEGKTGLRGLVRSAARKVFGSVSTTEAAFVGLVAGVLLTLGAYGAWRLARHLLALKGSS